jgi:hypothetical protein
MGVNNFNAAGYPDPTAFEAISKTIRDEKKRESRAAKADNVSAKTGDCMVTAPAIASIN